MCVDLGTNNDYFPATILIVFYNPWLLRDTIWVFKYIQITWGYTCISVSTIDINLIHKAESLFVCLCLIQIHISKPIWTKLCTHLPLGLEETVGYVWSENVWYFPPFWPFSSGASAESSARNGCRRRSSSTALYPRFLLLLVWRHGNYEADDSFAFCKTHPRQRYICDSCWC